MFRLIGALALFLASALALALLEGAVLTGGGLILMIVLAIIGIIFIH